MNKFNLATLNIRGLCNKNKCEITKLIIEENQIDVMYIQESYINNNRKLNELRKIFINFDIYYSFGENNSKGVLIIINKTLKYKLLYKNEDMDGRFIHLKILIEDKIYNLINIYAPNHSIEQLEFIDYCFTQLANLKENIILGGDFNSITNVKLDTTNKSRSNLKNYENEWINLFNTFNLEDILQDHLNQNQFKSKYMTWTNNTIATRIDKIYYNKMNSNISIKYINTKLYPESDHRIIISSVYMNNNEKMRKTKNQRWILNEKILDDEFVDSRIIKLCNEYKNNHLNTESYDTFIENIRQLLIAESKFLQDEMIERLKFLQNKYNQLIDLNDENSKIKRQDIKIEISNYYKEKIEGIKKRSRLYHIEFAKTPSKVFIQEEINKNKQNSIININQNNTIIGDQQQILSAFTDDYKKLFNIQHNSIKSNFNVPQVSDEMNKLLEKDLSYDECYDTIKNLNDVAPGKNGLTVKFYKKYFKHFGQCLIDNIKRNNGEDIKQLKQSIIRLIPKNDKSIKETKDYRPITITNVEYKIITKVLSNRLNTVLNEIIGPEQTCGLKGRSIKSNVITIRDTIYDANIRKRVFYVVALDQEKAFDRIQHQYIFDLLKHINLNDKVYKLIYELYQNNQTQLLINGEFSTSIDIHNGIKQGCALSMLLYILCIEEIIIRIKLNQNIHGYKVNSHLQTTIKIVAYADDTTIIVTDETSVIEIKNEFDRWCLYSGAKLNITKTSVLTNDYLFQNRLNIIIEENLKILGIYFNINGLSKKNFDNISNQINLFKKTWYNINLSMIERCLAINVFLLSKLWYIANFHYFKDEQLKLINKTIHNFIWHSNSERIKRDSLIMNYDDGGLKLVKIKAKLQAMQIKHFIEITNNYEKPCNQYAIIWLKFLFRKHGLKTNFNNIPYFSESEIPVYYKQLNKNVKNFIINNNIPLTELSQLKIIYNEVVKQYYIKPKLEQNGTQIGWNNIQYKCMNPLYREYNYLLAYNAFPYLRNKSATKRCCFCKFKLETPKHILYECRIVRNLQDRLKQLIDKWNYNEIIFMHKINKQKTIIFSIYKYVILSTRNLLFKKETIANVQEYMYQTMVKQIKEYKNDLNI